MTVREDFQKFLTQSNFITLAIAFVVGAAFTALVTALVADIFTPLIGAAVHINFSAWTLTINGSTIMQGAFLNALISFVILMLVVFFVIALPYMRYQARLAAKTAATTRPCPECLTNIPLAATRCSACCVAVPPAPPVQPAAA